MGKMGYGDCPRERPDVVKHRDRGGFLRLATSSGLHPPRSGCRDRRRRGEIGANSTKTTMKPSGQKTPNKQIGLTLRRIFAIFATLCFSATVGRAPPFCVKTNGDDSLSGASWALALRSITNAIARAAAGDEVWVASGIYTQRVALKASVALYGGFNGTETARDQRNWKTNLSWIYGASLGTVVSINGGGPDTRLDGMAVTGGAGIFGGGISCSGAGAVLANNFIYGNTAQGGIGGGMYIDRKSVV